MGRFLTPKMVVRLTHADGSHTTLCYEGVTKHLQDWAEARAALHVSPVVLAELCRNTPDKPVLARWQQRA